MKMYWLLEHLVKAHEKFYDLALI